MPKCQSASRASLVVFAVPDDEGFQGPEVPRSSGARQDRRRPRPDDPVCQPRRAIVRHVIEGLQEPCLTG